MSLPEPSTSAINAPLGSSLQVGLKEWASVCQALESGRQILLLRKGGISESGGEFEVKHRTFLLFPTYVHQSLRMLKSEAHAGFEERSQEPAELRLSSAGVVTDILRVVSRQKMDTLNAEHIWTEPLIDMRFAYNPAAPLYLMLVRVYRLRQPAAINNTPDYGGCKSWVPLESPISTDGALPVLDPPEYENRRQKIMGMM